ncbi:MAG: exonuclease SbcCD subunit D C-terminal domain-containing protein [Caldisericia bacterium]|nr:exonuclease SbcCD subunit D C-terminal domain-containing protein [Caldisericia bacterium]
MKILHTSDWHLGRTLYGRKRYTEYEAFLEWLIEQIKIKGVDILLIAGDIFDTSMPSNYAQELYYGFLCNASNCCSHIVVISGNHDSPSFLDASKELLKTLNVHVVGSMSSKIDNEVIVLKKANTPECIVCAVPYLRDKDIRIAEAGESIDEKNIKLAIGIQKHYESVCNIALKKQIHIKEKYDVNAPIIGMGHLFAAGGRTVQGDGVRELYVGSLAHVSKDVFPKCIDYMALGHLHVPQKVGGSTFCQYSGSPLAMGFGEANNTKKVILLDFKNNEMLISDVEIPCFQKLVSITGDLQEIVTRIEELKLKNSNAWLEIEYTGTEILPDLKNQIESETNDTEMEIRRIKNTRIIDKVLNRTNIDETLDDLDVNDVFMRCLEANEVDEDKKEEFLAQYKEIVKLIKEEDINAE